MKKVFFLACVGMAFVCCSFGGENFSARGDILFAHFGISGPATLALSAFAALELLGWIVGYKHRRSRGGVGVQANGERNFGAEL